MIDLENERILEAKYCYLLLEPKYIQYNARFFSEVREDEYSPYEHKLTHTVYTMLREYLVGVDIVYVDKTNLYKVVLVFAHSEPWMYHMDELSKARNIQKKILDYLTYPKC